MILNRISEDELPDEDILEAIQDQASGLCQDLDLGGRDLRTQTKLIQLDPDENNIDYIVSAALVDYEPVSLEYSHIDGKTQAWTEANLVSFRAYSEHLHDPTVICAFYNYNTRLRVNLQTDDVLNREWRLGYRSQLLMVLQSTSRIPLPTNFARFFKLLVANSLRGLPAHLAMEWKMWWNTDDPMNPGRWQQYVNQNVEDPIQPLARYDSFRGRRRISPRAVLPRQ